ncbi:hypothetical protein QBC47DRAFT_407085 [Echria macrotheca]|uniref:Uncharacterized protein n=1 Tax=Echria macrotheca TaxID=438768 RepID=A0AAJ0F0S5_9PEZI|nr:hypothetical protein QBC47DRAFT_407085 [Echria macrotheca]
MAKSQKQGSRKQPSKKQVMEALRDYLAGAHGTYISGISWTTQWRDLHGEGRTSSSMVFHIKVKKTSAKPPTYHTVIASGQRSEVFVDGTEMVFAEEPDLRHILNQYKRSFGVDVTTPTDDERR